MKTSARPGFSILVSPDSRLALGEVQSRLKAYPPAGCEWTHIVFWGDEEPDDKFWSAFRQNGLFASSNAIIVRCANLWPASVWRAVSGALTTPNENVWLFLLLENDWDSRKPKIPAFILKTSCYEVAQKKAWIWSSPPLAGDRLAAHIEKAAAQRGLKLSRAAISCLQSNVPANAAAIASELDKLKLLSPEGLIGEEALQCVAADPELDAHDLVLKLETGDTSGAWRHVFSSSASSLLFYLIVLLAGEFRVIWQLAKGENPWVRPNEIRLKRSLANSMSFSDISKGFCLLAEAEWRVKSGDWTVDQTLELLIFKASELFASAGKRQDK